MIPEHNTGQEIYLEHMTRYVFSSQFVKDKVVLDIACGSGYGTDYLLKVGARKVIGADISEETIDYCKNKYSGKDIEFLVGGVEKIPVEDNCVDVIVSFETIEHVNETAQIQFLCEAKRVLKPDGIFVVSTPNSWVYIKGNPFHVKELDPKEFGHLLKENFKNVEIFYQDDIESSYVYSKENLEGVSKKFEVNEKIDRILPEASMYLIAVCGDTSLVNITEYLGLSNRKPYVTLLNEVNARERIIQQKDLEMGNKIEIIKSKDKEIQSKSQELDSTKTQLEYKSIELSDIYRSKGWRMIVLLRKVLESVLPKGSRRRRLVAAVVRFCKIVVSTFRKNTWRSIFGMISSFPNLQKNMNVGDNQRFIDKILGTNYSDATKIDFQMQTDPEVSIIIPVYDKWQFTYNCLFSLKKNTSGVKYEIIIVDNASTDDTGRLFSEKVQNVTYHRNDANLGFAKACNQGAAKAKGKYIVFLNNDTVPLTEWLTALIGELGHNPVAGIVGSKLIYPNGMIQHAGVIFPDNNNPLHPQQIQKNLKSWNHRKVNKKIMFRAVTGACIAMRKKLFTEVRGFDEDYLNSYEDTDLCFKVAALGYSIIYCPESQLIHYESMSSGRFDADLKNRSLFVNKWSHSPILKNGLALGRVVKTWPRKNIVPDYVYHNEKPYYYGVNLFGYYSYQFGLSKNIHSFKRFLSFAGIPLTVSDISAGGHKRHEVDAEPIYRSDYCVNVVFINPDRCRLLFEQYPYRSYFLGKYNIAYWVHETDKMPDAFFEFASFFDEIWTPSEFSKEILSRLGKKIVVVPMIGNFIDQKKAVVVPSLKSLLLGADGRKRFFFMVDYYSCPYRKNVLLVIQIFRHIFTTGRSYELVLRIKNAPQSFIDEIESLVKGFPIHILVMELSPEELCYIYNNIDYYVSLHASEGYGLTVLESIYYNVMPIVTAYGGVMDFCDSKNSILVDFDMVDIPKESSYHGQGKWARPDFDDAVRKITSLLDKKAIRRPSQKIFEKINDESLSREIVDRLKQIKPK